MALPNRTIRLTVQHPTTQAAPGDPPLAPGTLAGWELARTQGGSNEYAVIETLLLASQTQYDDVDRPPGTWNYRVVWIDIFGQRSSERVTGIQVPLPAPPSSGQFTSIQLV